MARRSRGSIGTRRDRAGYWIRYVDRTGRRRQVLGGDTIAEAEQLLRMLLEEEDDAASADAAPIQHQVPADPCLDDFLEDEYLKRIQSRLTPTTFGVQRGDLRRAARHFEAIPMRSIGEADADRYLIELAEGADRKAGPRAPATVLRHRSTLSSCWKVALKRHHVDVNPWLMVRDLARPQPTHVPFFEERQLRALYRLVEPRYRPFVTFLGETAMRRGEALALTWSHVSPAGDAVTIVRSKTKRSRTIPLRPLARQVLEDLRDGATRKLVGETRVFADIGASWPKGAREAWQAAAAKFRHPDLRLQDLRHARASLLVRGGVPVPTVARWLGHATPHLVLTRYGHHAPADELQQALRVSVEAEERAAAARRARRDGSASSGRSSRPGARRAARGR